MVPYACLESITEVFVHSVRGKGPITLYGEEVVEGLPRVRRFDMDHLQNLKNPAANEGRAGATMSRNRYDLYRNRVKVVRYLWGEVGR
jgi:hypothetical protein